VVPAATLSAISTVMVKLTDAPAARLPMVHVTSPAGGAAAAHGAPALDTSEVENAAGFVTLYPHFFEVEPGS
jgi:hypothetical protein